MGFASVVGQSFLIIIFMLVFAQLYITQHRQNELQTEIFAYQREKLAEAQDTQIEIVSLAYNTTWNVTSLQLRNKGSRSIAINTSDLYIGDEKFDRNYTSRKFFACYEYSGYRCGELRFGDLVNNEEVGMQLLYHFNNDSQWRTFPGRYEDYSAVSNNDITVNNVPTTDTGYFDKAADFNGANGYLNRTNTAQNQFTNTTSYTWAFWINPASFPSPTSTIVSKNAAATGYRIYLNSTGGVIVQSPNGNRRFNCTLSIPLNKWSFVTVVYSGAEVRFYINGTSINNQSTLSQFRSDTTSQFNIGRNASSANNYYDGLLDEFVMYNVAKSDGDILALYRKGVYAGSTDTFDPGEIMEIDAWDVKPSGTYPVTFSTADGISVSRTMVVP